MQPTVNNTNLGKIAQKGQLVNGENGNIFHQPKPVKHSTPSHIADQLRISARLEAGLKSNRR